MDELTDKEFFTSAAITADTIVKIVENTTNGPSVAALALCMAQYLFWKKYSNDKTHEDLIKLFTETVNNLEEASSSKMEILK